MLREHVETFAFTNHLTMSNVLYCSRLCQQGFSDSRFGDIVIVKPMRDYSAKEIAYYNRMFSVPSVFIPSLETKVSLKTSGHPAWAHRVATDQTHGSVT